MCAQVVSGYTGLRAPSLDIVRQFNFPASSKASMVTAPINALLQCGQPAPAEIPVSAPPESNAAAAEAGAEDGKQDTPMADAGAEQAAEALTPAQEGDAAVPVAGTTTAEAEPVSNGTTGAAEGGVAQTVAESRSGHDATSSSTRELPVIVQQTCRQGFSCCILAAPQVQPLALLRKVLPLLAPSAAFAVFANCLQPLADCMLALQVNPLVLMGRLCRYCTHVKSECVRIMGPLW